MISYTVRRPQNSCVVKARWYIIGFDLFEPIKVFRWVRTYVAAYFLESSVLFNACTIQATLDIQCIAEGMIELNVSLKLFSITMRELCGRRRFSAQSIGSSVVICYLSCALYTGVLYTLHR